jgi:predicted permease
MIRLYRLSLLLLPPAFRRRYGAELDDQARARLGEARTRRARIGVALDLASDLVRAVAREWWDVCVQEGRTGMGGGMSSDARWALRALTRAPGFAAAVVATLGLGIGTTTVALGLVDAYLLRSLPFPEGDRLVAVWPEENWSRQMLDMARQGFPSLVDVAGAGGAMLVLQEGGEPEELFASQATTNLHDVLGVRPALGRDFLPGDAIPGAEAVALLSHRLWVERFGADPSIIGRSVALGGEGHLRRTVVGVMPQGYLPLQGAGVDAWVPVVIDPADGEYGDSYFMDAVGRLRPTARPDDARRDIAAWARRMAEVNPEWFTPERVRRASIPPLARERTADRRTPVLVALGAALLVLLVACANVANLVVARTTGRERELSVRAALGAGRLRTARTILVEVSILALAGGALGLVVALGLVRGLERWYPGALPEWGLGIDVRWAAAALGLGALATLVAGLVPALQAARRDPARAMAGGRGATGRRRLTRLQELLSASQLAMATAGIAAMGLLGHSLMELSDVDPGFATPRRVTFRVTAPPAAYPADADVTRFFRHARAALAEVPGVEAVGFVSRLPLAGGDSRSTVTPEGWEFAEGEAHPVAWHRLVTPGYLEAMGARLLEGRIPTAADDREGLPELVVVNRAAARTYWPGESAVGKRFYGPEHRVWLTVAGVVEDFMENGQTRPVLPGLYVPHRDWPWRTMYAVVRARTDPAALMPDLKQAIWSVSPGVPISRVETLDQVAARGLRPTRTLALLAALAGAVTLLLGALGIYAVVSHAVARRTRELGVRAALGAGRARLLRGELAGVSRIVATGVGAGLLLAGLAGRALRGTLYGVGAIDLPSLAAAVTLLGGVAYLAAWLPARRAATVDPVRVMREE